MPSLTDPRTVAASAGGGVLSAATAAISAVRPARKPLHPRGEVVRCTLRRFGATPGTGVAWLDEPGIDTGLARVSRAIGLPAPTPDVHGLALRVVTSSNQGDLLFATTGTGRITRFVLTATRRPGGRPMTTLLPYRTPSGGVLLGAEQWSPFVWSLSVASLRGPWRRFAELTLSDDPGGDPTIDFDPVLNTVPGLEVYDWVRRIREPAYRTARRSRRH